MLPQARVELEEWWNVPVIKDESVIFEEIENTVLYDELKVVLKESRLEVIELPETISAIMQKIHLKHFWYHEIIELIEKVRLWLAIFYRSLILPHLVVACLFTT